MNPFENLHPLVPILIILVAIAGVIALLIAARLARHDAPPRQPMMTEPDQRIDDVPVLQRPRRKLSALVNDGQQPPKRRRVR